MAAMRSLKPHRSKSEPPRAGDSSSTEDTALPVEISDELVAAGLAIGEPMGRDRPGHFAPRRALDTSGRDVVVQVVDVAEGAAGARALRRLANLRLLRSEAIVGVRQVISLPGGRVGVISDLVVGADLAVVLGARGGLTRDEAARLLDDLGAALAHPHERGMVHGDVAAANVIVDTDGRPVLIDLLGGVLETGTESSAAPERGTGGPATAAADVYSLAALLRQCAAGSPALAERLDRVLLDALDPDPARRPSARDLAARAPEIGRPGAIELPDGARLAAGALRAATAQPTRAVASRRGRAPGARRPARPRGLTGPPTSHRRRAALLGLVLLMLSAVVVAVGAGALVPGWAPDRILGRDDAPSTTEASASTMTAEAVAQDATDADAADAVAMDAADAGETDMLPVVVELSVTRDAALNEGDAEALASTTAPGSPAALADQVLLTALADAGERVEGLDTMVHSVTSAQAERAGDDWPGATVVRVSQSQGPSVRIGADGSRRAVPAQASRDVVLVLVPDPWRVVEVLQAD